MFQNCSMYFIHLSERVRTGNRQVTLFRLRLKLVECNDMENCVKVQCIQYLNANKNGLFM